VAVQVAVFADEPSLWRNGDNYYMGHQYANDM